MWEKFLPYITNALCLCGPLSCCRTTVVGRGLDTSQLLIWATETHLLFCTIHQSSWESILIEVFFHYLVATAVQPLWFHRLLAAGCEDMTPGKYGECSGFELFFEQSIHQFVSMVTPWGKEEFSIGIHISLSK